MARGWSAKANQVAIAQLVQVAQEVVLIAQPGLVQGQDRGPVAVPADHERVSPFRAPADVDGALGYLAAVVVEDENRHRHPSGSSQLAGAPANIGAICHSW